MKIGSKFGNIHGMTIQCTNEEEMKKLLRKFGAKGKIFHCPDIFVSRGEGEATLFKACSPILT
jgi:hypothetical protein